MPRTIREPDSMRGLIHKEPPVDVRMSLDDIDAALRELNMLHVHPNDDGGVANIRQRLGWIRKRLERTAA